MTPAEEIEHLRYHLEELTTPPAEWVELSGVSLSPAEGRIAGALIARGGKVVPHSALFSALAWDRAPSDEPHAKTVDILIHRIRRKFRKAGIPDPIVNQYGVGFRWQA